MENSLVIFFIYSLDKAKPELLSHQFGVDYTVNKDISARFAVTNASVIGLLFKWSGFHGINANLGVEKDLKNTDLNWGASFTWKV